MNIQKICNISFGNEKSYEICKKYPNSFSTMTVDDKLDVLYGMLKEQKQDLVTLSKNQAKIQKCNDTASVLILNNVRCHSGIDDETTLGNCFDHNKINLIV